MHRAAVWMLVLALAVPSLGGAEALTVPRTAVAFMPTPAATGPVALRTFFTTSGLAGGIAADTPRGRILVTATFNLGDPDSTSYLLILDLAGNLIGNLSLGRRVWDGPRRIAIDPASGMVYLPTANSTILKVDPGAPIVLAEWTEPSAPDTLYFAAGSVYAQTRVGDLYRLSPADGSRLENWTVPAHSSDTDLLVDPTGRWIFFCDDSYSWRIDTSNDSRTYLGWLSTFALSADGSRVFILTYGTGFSQAWLSNGTIERNPFGLGPSPYPFRANPVTGVLAFGLYGYLLDPDTGEGIPMVHDEAPLYFADLAWSADGTALFALEDEGGGPYPIVVREWSGSPWLDVPSPWLLNPKWDPACALIMSTTLMDDSTLTLYRDGSPYLTNWTTSDQVCFNEEAYGGNSTLTDGVHTGRVTGLDRLGQRLDVNVTFETDGTPPQIAVTSPLDTSTVPYVLAGRLNETHPYEVLVNGSAATLAGRDWSRPESLLLGNNSFLIEARDTLGSYASASVVVRYWPAYRDNVTNRTGDFRVYVPPGWVGQADVNVSGLRGVTLSNPSTNPFPATVLIVGVSHPEMTETSAFAMLLAQEAEAYSRSIGGTITVASHPITADGHPGAMYESILFSPAGPMRYVQAIVVSAAWHCAYILTFGFPDAAWPQLRETRDWILQGFRIEAAPAGGPGVPGDMTFAWIAAGGIGAAAAVALALVLWRRRQKPAPGGPIEAMSPDDVPPTPSLEDLPPGSR